MSKKLIFKKFKDLFSSEKSRFSSLVGALMMALASGNLMAIDSAAPPSGADGFVKTNNNSNKYRMQLNDSLLVLISYNGNDCDLKNYTYSILYPNKNSDQYDKPISGFAKELKILISRIKEYNKESKKNIYTDDFFISDDVDSEFVKEKKFLLCTKPVLFAEKVPESIETGSWVLKDCNKLASEAIYIGNNQDLKRYIDAKGVKILFDHSNDFIQNTIGNQKSRVSKEKQCLKEFEDSSMEKELQDFILNDSYLEKGYAIVKFFNINGPDNKLSGHRIRVNITRNLDRHLIEKINII